MIDSNQGPVRRLYVSAEELSIILNQNGVTFIPELDTTPRLLRERGAP
jgi:hypothetical protein